MSGRNYLLILAAITVAGFILRILWLSGMPPTVDGVSSVSAAWEYMHSGNFGVVMWQHPKLRNILVYYSVNLLGGNAWGLNFWSIVFGVMAIPLISSVTARLSGSLPAGLAAALFIAIDPIHIDFSRQAIQEIYVPFFSLLGIYWALRFSDSGRDIFLLASGVAFGLGLASKWNVMFPLAAILIYLLICCRENRDSGTMSFILSSLLLIPVAVYLLTFLPWVIGGGNGLADLVDVHRLMSSENLVHAGFNPYHMELDSKAYLWFLKPVAYVDFIIQGKSPIILLAITNPLVWMCALPALVVVLREVWRNKNAQLFLLAALFLCSYLPLVLVQRPIWVNSSPGVSTFAFMLIGFAAVMIRERMRTGKMVFLVYSGLVILTAIPLYLLTVGKGYHTPLLHSIVEQYRPANERQGMPLQ